MFFELLQVFHVEPFIWTTVIDCSNSINHDQEQVLSTFCYSYL